MEFSVFLFRLKRAVPGRERGNIIINTDIIKHIIPIAKNPNHQAPIHSELEGIISTLESQTL